MVSFQGEMWTYLLLLGVGSLVYVGFGDYTLNLYSERILDPLTKINGLGLDYEVFTRIHMFGLFLGALGIVGLIVKMRKIGLLT